MKGLYNKYQVTKKDGKIDEDAIYFVLRIDKDIHARRALRRYIQSVENENKNLATDLELLYRDTEDVFFSYQKNKVLGSDSKKRPA